MATGLNPTKKARLSSTTRPPTSSLPPDPAQATPLAAAKSTLQHCHVSLPVQAAALLSRLGTKTLNQLLKLHQKGAQVKKLEDDAALIPRSARIKFALNPSKTAEQAPEYLTLKGDTEQLVSDIQGQLKAKVLATLRLEISTSKSTFLDDFVTSLRLATHALTLSEPHLSPTHLDQICNTIFERHSDRLFKHLDTPVHNIRQCYCRVHALETLPNPFPEPAVTDVPAVAGLPPNDPDLNDPVLGFAYLPAPNQRNRVLPRRHPTD